MSATENGGQLVMVQTPPCRFCEIPTYIQLPASRLNRWQAGENIQDVFPELAPEVREILISGTHPHCWDQFMGPGE